MKDNRIIDTKDGGTLFEDIISLFKFVLVTKGVEESVAFELKIRSLIGYNEEHCLLEITVIENI